VAVLLVPRLVPVHPAARRGRRPIEALRLALAGGEDYELCFTAELGAVEGHVDAFERAFGVRLTCVGRVGRGDGVWFVDPEGHRRPLGMHGYRHFEEEEGA
jgi:thiamine-monophosphate kinase